jgi:hypothetical protein
MNDVARLTASLSLILALAGCTSTSSNSEVSVTLSAAGGSGESGTAVLTAISSSSTEVSITTTGGTDTGVQSAVIRAGQCGGTGTVLAELNNLQGEESVTTIPDELSSMRNDQYAIDVHSSTNIDDVVACGEID